MIPRMLSHPIEPLIFTYFTVLASTHRGRAASSAINFALDYQVVPVSLIGVVVLAGRLPDPVRGLRRRDRATFRAVLGRNLVDDRRSDDARRDRAVRRLRASLVEVLLGGGEFGPDDVARTSAVVAAFALSVPFDALAYPLSRGLYATHDTIRQVVASFAGFGVGRSSRRRSSRPGSGSWRSRSATPPG